MLAMAISGQSVNELYKKCDAAYGKPDYADAVRRCTKVIEADGGHIEARLTRAAAYEKLGNDEAAVGDYSELIRGGATAMLYFYRGGLYSKRGQRDAAIADLTASLEREPKGRYAARSLVLRGSIYDELKRDDDAQADYWRASGLDPNFPGLKAKLKYPFGDKTLTEAAEIVFPGMETIPANPKPAKQAPPTNAPGGMVQAAPAASVAMPTPLAKPVLTPTPAPVTPTVAVPASSAPSKTAPVKPVDTQDSKPVDNGAWIKALSAGTAKLNKKDYAGAVKSYSECLSSAPKAIYCLQNRAMAYYFQKNYEPALSDIDAAIKIDPEVADFYNIRAFIRFNSDDLIGASGDMDRAVKLEPENAEWYANRALINCKIKEFSILAAEDEQKARQLGGKIAKPCKQQK